MSEHLQYLGLSEENLPQASKLAERVFSYLLPSAVRPDACFRASLDPTKLDELNRKIDGESEAEKRLAPQLQYWIATLRGRIVGVTGLYRTVDDNPDVRWLGWFCLDDSPEVRGQGFGDELIQFTIDQARREGTKILRIETSDVPEEQIAQKVYEKAGFRIASTEPHPSHGHNWIIRERNLEE